VDESNSTSNVGHIDGAHDQGRPLVTPGVPDGPRPRTSQPSSAPSTNPTGISTSIEPPPAKTTRKKGVSGGGIALSGDAAAVASGQAYERGDGIKRLGSADRSRGGQGALGEVAIHVLTGALRDQVHGVVVSDIGDHPRTRQLTGQAEPGLVRGQRLVGRL